MCPGVSSRPGWTALSRAVHRLEKFGVADGLEQVVEGVDPEPLHGIVAVGGHEHHPHPGLPGRAGQFEPRQAGHLNVEKGDVGVGAAYGLQRLGGRGVASGQLEAVGLAHIALDELHGQGFVVCDDASERFHCSRIFSSTRQVPPEDFFIVSEAAPP